MTDADKASLADSVTRVVNTMIQGLHRPNVDSLAARYDAGVVYGRDGRIFGRDTLLAAMRANWRPGVSASLGTSDATVRVLGRDAAVFSANLSGVITDSAAGRSAEILGALTFVLERRDGTWRVVAGHESVAPDAERHAAVAAVRR